ncbi:hypothetical protein ACFO4L_01820 [Bacillus daqingensis]|uniref:Uncharacterized protein n=1 Tax=Bacillus daqingensis TaxID=872396 RepID=A0ABV9NSK5_9BACI
MRNRLLISLLLLAACSPQAEAEEVTAGSEPEAVHAYIQTLQEPGIYLYHTEEAGYVITKDRPVPVQMETTLEDDLLLLHLTPADDGKISSVYRISMDNIHAIELLEADETTFFSDISGF